MPFEIIATEIKKSPLAYHRLGEKILQIDQSRPDQDQTNTRPSQTKTKTIIRTFVLKEVFDYQYLVIGQSTGINNNRLLRHYRPT